MVVVVFHEVGAVMVKWTAIPKEKMKKDAVSISFVTALTVGRYRLVQDFLANQQFVYCANCFDVTVAVAFVVL